MKNSILGLYGNVGFDLGTSCTRVYTESRIAKYGMSDIGLGQVNELDGEIAKIVYEEANKILGECYNDAVKIIKDNKEAIDKVLDYIMEKGEITQEEFLKYFIEDI